MFLPMSCTSPLTVASSTLPCALCAPSRSSSMNGCRYATPRFITRADLAGIDVPQVEAGTHRVVEEGCMHRLAHDVVPAEGEAEVRDAARGTRSRAALLDLRQALDERTRVVVVLFDPGRDGEHVRIE